MGDPLLWGESTYLLVGPSHAAAKRRLDELNASPVIEDPLARAVLQQDLWAIFDWTARRREIYPQARRELQLRLANAIGRLLLTTDEIRTLPDNYRQAVAAGRYRQTPDPSERNAPFLPADLFAPDGPWVPLSDAPWRRGPLARQHASEASGRAVFQVLMRLPGGREATLAYLERLSAFPQPWLPDSTNEGRLQPNPDLPQFPPGTQLALVRRPLVIDATGRPVPTELTTHLQLRIYGAIPTTIPRGAGTNYNEVRESQDVFEFTVSRTGLFSGDAGGLHAVEATGTAWPTFSTHGWDPLDLQRTEAPRLGPVVVLESCVGCHFRPGIHSVNSRSTLFGPPVRLSHSTVRAADIHAAEWKQGQYDWGLLHGLWTAAGSALRR